MRFFIVRTRLMMPGTSRFGAPKTVILRMLANVAIDTVVGAVPVVGDLFDAGWKSNTRNLALLERQIGQPSGETAANRAVIWLTVAVLALLAVGAVMLAVFLVRALLDGFA